MSLIYLLSSLPTLTFGTPPALTPEAFLEACHEQLNPTDAHAAAALLRGEPCTHPFALAWQDKETILRNAIARLRARRINQEATRWLHTPQGCDSQIESLVEDAFEEPDALKREQALDKARWLIAEELEGPDPLSVKMVFGYAIRLALAIRWTQINVESGQKAFETLTDTPMTLRTTGA